MSLLSNCFTSLFHTLILVLPTSFSIKIYIFVYAITHYLTCSVLYVYAILDNDIKEGDIRLVAGSYLWQGLVEIFSDGVWGTINRDDAHTNEARVVCRQLGYHTYSKIIILDYGVTVS